MRTVIALFIFSCFSCSLPREYEQFVGQTKDHLISLKGEPFYTKKDKAGGEQIFYREAVKMHNPKYLYVTKIVTFYVNREGEVFKWTEEKYKETGLTPKPSLAIE